MEINIQNSLPLGHLVLDKQEQFYTQKFDILEKAQEIFEDFKLDNNKNTNISNSLAILYAKDEGNIPPLIEFFQKDAMQDFEVVLVELSEATSINGSFGNFVAKLNNEEEILFSQAVLFVNDENLLRFRGIYSVADFDNPSTLLATLKSNLGTFSYKEIITYKDDACQYHHRREKHCGKCADICPTFGVGANDNLMELVFSPIDCISCGACVGVCPTSSLTYEDLPKEGLEEIIDLYKESKIFLCDLDSYENLARLNFTLPQNLTPLILPNLKMLNENDYLTMLQTSGNDLLVFNHQAPMIDFINNITQNAYQKNAILQASTPQEIEEYAQQINSFESYLYKNRYNKPHRESFAQRLQYIIKDKDFGIAKSVAPVYYGNIKIDKDKCTLCLSCVGACNVNAIFAKSDDFSLRFNPSLCTTCGYCVDSCPEKIMDLNRDGLELNPDYFKSRELAKDEPFLCVECGKPFSTKKSIDKIFTMLSASFSKDPQKLRTLQCCPDCKVRVMFANKV